LEILLNKGTNKTENSELVIMNEDLKFNEHMQEEMKKEITVLRQEIDSIQTIRNKENTE
jgi:hypothetical protein